MQNKLEPKPRTLSVEQVASELQVSTRTVWRLLSSGELIAPVRIGGSTRWRRAELDAWLEEGCPAVTGSEDRR